MEKNILVKILALIVAVVGLLVMVGWFLDISILKSILPTLVTMKFTTALSFFLSGIILYAITWSMEGKKDIASIVLTITTLIILLLMGTLLSSTFMGIRTGIEDLFVEEAIGAVKTTTPGRPSAGTMLNFILMASAGIIVMLSIVKCRVYLKRIGWAVIVFGSVALIGYTIGMPLLYYTIEGFSTAMAIHTAILFVLLGVGLIVLKKKEL
jgi:hypothetical protein